jgi:hypothetical protein
MSSHILVSRAFRFPVQAPKLGDGWAYRRDIGAWVDADLPSNLMVDPNPKPEPRPHPQPRPEPYRPKPRPASKKFDVETGEDLKGE